MRPVAKFTHKLRAEVLHCLMKSCASSVRTGMRIQRNPGIPHSRSPGDTRPLVSAASVFDVLNMRATRSIPQTFELLEPRLLMARTPGIDVSQFQSTIGWNSVHAAGK